MSEQVQIKVQMLAATLNEVANELIAECNFDWSLLTVEGKSVCGMMVSNAYLLVNGAKKTLLVTPEMGNRIRDCSNSLSVLDERIESYLFTVNSNGEYEFEMH
ncbi:hypothetical protein R7D97_16495 [Vibrio sp. Vb5031]|uniref:Uncharacterized protein n=1 Tax=Vibrio hepatarius TaxID=171383 RepID=A0A0M0HYK8_9VIBR|nr:MULTISPECIES: hypothetical protein [Vibrio]KOO06937.1 hypothetical protein AKJ31_14660 [Vibrio hepatarius]MCA2422211.1 hypothetical protein [Vibrio alginolyticus]MCA2446850.1 hypothetical protein [Vibrio alginolyticus]MCR9821599.1 hypothetical protein [Vibrio parahaemolyticus]MDF5109064.1 hypothetical protein [Vibrio parahaemolyticus]